MKNIILGKSGSKKVEIDLRTLLLTRLLIQANSGGGKSYALRRILERAFGKVQCIVIDPAGEFSSLREKFDFVLIGESGDAPADIRSASLVATKLLEMRASAVCDLYSLKGEQRHLWVQGFLNTIMNAPKKLWHPVIIAIDEAHKFCPEKGEGESAAKSEVLNLCSDGRKYGYCGILATQRLAKLDKSAAAEMLNVLIGPTFLDTDLERAHKALGIIRSEWSVFDADMKSVDPGNFWALGRAISKTRILVKVGDVKTTHPEAGATQYVTAPPPSAKIRALLPQLADLPQLAETKAKNEKELRGEIAQLKRELTMAQRSAPARIETKTEVKEIKVPIILNGQLKKMEKVVGRLERIAEPFFNLNKSISVLADFGKQVGSASNELAMAIRQSIVPKAAGIPRQVAQPAPKFANATRAIPFKREMIAPPAIDEKSPLGKGERLCLIAIAQHSEGVERDTITQITGYKRSSRDAYLQRLRNRGFINDGQTITATPEGIAVLGDDYKILPTGHALQQHWMSRLPAGEKNVLAVACEVYPSRLERAMVDEKTGYQRSSRDAYINRLQARRLLEQGYGPIKASEKLFD